MMGLIRRTFWHWFGHKDDAIQCGAEAFDSQQVSSKMTNDNAIDNRFSIFGSPEQSGGLQSDLAYSIEMTIKRSCVEIDKRSIPARYSGNAALNARNAFNDLGSIGFVGHDGLPWLWETSKECWLPVTESSYAAAYATLKRP